MHLALPAVALVWFGCGLLLLRGGAGIIDDLIRATGLRPNGLTGLSTRETTGTAALSWSGWAIEASFLAGGIIFGLLAVRYRAQQSHSRRQIHQPGPGRQPAPHHHLIRA